MATQAEVADLLGLTDRQIRNLQSGGYLHKGAGRGGMQIKRAVQEYITYLKAGREISEEGDDTREEGGSELDRERKALNNEILREKLKLLRQENAPIWLLGDALGKIVGLIPAQLNSMAMKIKLAVPDLPERAMDEINGAIVELKNALAAIELDLSDYEQEEDGDEE